MQYVKWSAIFFAIKNKDQDMAKFLIRNNARMDIKDEVARWQFSSYLIISLQSMVFVYLCTQYDHTPFSISKGLILDEKIKMYKFLVNLVYPPEDESQETTSSSPQPVTTSKVEKCRRAGY